MLVPHKDKRKLSNPFGMSSPDKPAFSYVNNPMPYGIPIYVYISELSHCSPVFSYCSMMRDMMTGDHVFKQVDVMYALLKDRFTADGDQYRNLDPFNSAMVELLDGTAVNSISNAWLWEMTAATFKRWIKNDLVVSQETKSKIELLLTYGLNINGVIDGSSDSPSTLIARAALEKEIVRYGNWLDDLAIRRGVSRYDYTARGDNVINAEVDLDDRPPARKI